MKRILIIQESLNVGGAETLLTGILPYIDSSKYEVTLLLLHKGGVLNSALPSNVKVEYFFGNTFQYYAAISKSEYGRKSLKNIIGQYFKNSYLNAVSSLVEEEEISIEELKQLIEKIKDKHQ